MTETIELNDKVTAFNTINGDNYVAYNDGLAEPRKPSRVVIKRRSSTENWEILEDRHYLDKFPGFTEDELINLAKEHFPERFL